MLASSKRTKGGGLILLSGLLGAAVAAYDYVTPSTGIDHSGGVELVLVASLLMAAAALGVLLLRSGVIAGILMFLIFLDILGSGTAAWFLESWLLMAAMATAAIGFTLIITSRAEGMTS